MAAIFQNGGNKMATVSNTCTCRPIIILSSENEIAYRIYSYLVTCLISLQLFPLNLKESSFYIFSFKTK